METQAVYERVGGNIKRAREHREVKQSELADALGVTRTVVTNMETGRQAVKVHQLLLIADVLDIPANELLQIDWEELKRSVAIDETGGLPESLASVVMQFQSRASR